jgi:hypothetical protein
VQIEYEQSRSGYRRKAYSAERGATTYKVAPAKVAGTAERFVQVVEVPEDARNVRFYPGPGKLPAKYRHALQNVR